jgi:tight adherence protein B
MSGEVLVGASAAALALVAAASRTRVDPGARPRRWSPAARRRRGRRRRKAGPPDDLAVASWCEHAARAVRSGRSVTAAIEQATDDVPELEPTMAPVVSAVRRGRPLGDAIGVLGATARSTRRALPATTLVASVLSACLELGGPIAPPLDRVGGVLRTRAALADEQQAQSAQARLSARVLTIVPLALLGLLAVSDAKVRAAIGTPAGMAAVTLGAILNSVGWWWMRRIVGAVP